MDLRSKQQHEFAGRHIGPNEQETAQMLKTIGMSSMDELIEKTVPASIRLKEELNVSAPISEFDYLLKVSAMGKKNELKKNTQKKLPENLSKK